MSKDVENLPVNNQLRHESNEKLQSRTNCRLEDNAEKKIYIYNEAREKLFFLSTYCLSKISLNHVLKNAKEDAYVRNKINI